MAIAIPVFTTQLEKSRETTDMANLRSAYGAATVKAMTDSCKDGTSYYNPQADGAIATTKPTTHVGQGTAANGKADVAQLAGGIITYANDTDAKNKEIAIYFKDGSVNAISFE